MGSILALGIGLSMLSVRSGNPRPRPRLCRNHHLGTEEQPYHITDPTPKRHTAIAAGIDELARDLEKQGIPEELARKQAVDKKRKRLILLRTFHRRKGKPCAALHQDVLWMYKEYSLPTSGLKFEC